MDSVVAVINRVKTVRLSLGLTQADLAERVDVTRQTVISIEKGRLNPSILLCLRMAQALNCNINELFYLAAGAAQHAHSVGHSNPTNSASVAQNG